MATYDGGDSVYDEDDDFPDITPLTSAGYGDPFAHSPNAIFEPERPSQSKPGWLDDVGGEFEAPLPTRVTGPLDSLVKKRSTEVQKYNDAAIKSPLFQVDGQISKRPPQFDKDSGSGFIPMGGKGFYINQPPEEEYIPIQKKLADQADKRIPRLPDGTPISDAHVIAEAGNIYQGLLQGSGGKLDPKSFIENNYWDQFKGMDPDALTAFKQSALTAIRPYVKHQQAVGQMQGLFGEISQDPMGQMFLEALPEAQKMGIAAVMSGQSLDYRGPKSIATAIAGKLDALEDPDNMKLFEQMQQSKDNEDQNKFKYLLKTNSTSAFLNGLTAFDKKHKVVELKRDADVKEVYSKLNDVPGKDAELVRDTLSGLVKSGEYDKNAEVLNNDIRMINGGWGEVTLSNGSKVPGLGAAHYEMKKTTELKKLNEQVGDLSKIFIGRDGTVYHGDNAVNNFKLKDLHQQFGDTKVKTLTPGEFVELDIEKFTDTNGGTVFLSLPGKLDESPVSYQVGTKQYVRRDVIKQFGITQDELSSGEPIPISDKLSERLSGKPSQYRAPLMTAEEYFDPRVKDGDRLKAKKEWFESFMQTKIQDQEKIKNNILISKPVEDPSWKWNFAKEAGKGFASSMVREAATIGMDVKILGDYQPATVVGNLLKFGFAKALGNEEAAKDALKVYTETGKPEHFHLGEQVEDAMQNGWLGLDVLNADPNAGTSGKLGGLLGHIAGDITTMVGEMAVTGPLGADAAAAKMAGYFDKVRGYSKQIEVLKKATGNSSEIIKLLDKQAKAAEFAKIFMGFQGIGLLQGKTAPVDLLDSTINSSLGAFPAVMGRGLRMPFLGKVEESAVKEVSPGVYDVAVSQSKNLPFYPDIQRSLASLTSVAGMGGYDAIRKNFDGMSWEEIQDQYKDPEFLGSMVANGFMNLLGGQKRSSGIDYVVPATKPKIEIAPAPARKTLDLKLRSKLESEYKSLQAIGDKRTKDQNQRMYDLTSEITRPDQIPSDAVPEAKQPRTVAEIDGRRARLAELTAKADSRTPEEAVEFHSILDELVDPKFDQYTREALAHRGGIIAEKVNNGRANADELAELQEIHRRLASGFIGKDIPFDRVIKKEEIDAPKLAAFIQHIKYGGDPAKFQHEGKTPKNLLAEVAVERDPLISEVSQATAYDSMTFVRASIDAPTRTSNEASIYNAHIQNLRNKLEDPDIQGTKTAKAIETLLNDPKIARGKKVEIDVTPRKKEIIDEPAKIPEEFVLAEDVALKVEEPDLPREIYDSAAEIAKVIDKVPAEAEKISKTRERLGEKEFALRETRALARSPGWFSVRYETPGGDVTIKVKANDSTEAESKALNELTQGVREGVSETHQVYQAAEEAVHEMDVSFAKEKIDKLWSEGKSLKDIAKELTSEEGGAFDQDFARSEIMDFVQSKNIDLNTEISRQKEQYKKNDCELNYKPL